MQYKYATSLLLVFLPVTLSVADDYEKVYGLATTKWYTNRDVHGTLPESILWNGYAVVGTPSTVTDAIQRCSEACSKAVFPCGAFIVAQSGDDKICGLFTHMPGPVDQSREPFRDVMQLSHDLYTSVYRPKSPKTPPERLLAVWECASYADWRKRVVQKYGLDIKSILPLRAFYALLCEYPLPRSEDVIMQPAEFEQVLQNPLMLVEGSSLDSVDDIRRQFSIGSHLPAVRTHQQYFNAIFQTLGHGIVENARLQECRFNKNLNVEGVIVRPGPPEQLHFEIREKGKASVFVSIGFEFSGEQIAQLNTQVKSVFAETYQFGGTYSEFAVQAYTNALLYGGELNKWKFSDNEFFTDAYQAMIWNVVGGTGWIELGEQQDFLRPKPRASFIDTDFIFTEM
ncbi:hypothetical protein NEOLI_005092 [Neolecta irregularis DAH-3]|uniref:Apple domain-containing protein n=1 Tax=Neolecta irregularis (strain DAH-3) TaxID=1198029 RepID=A0A1U7LN85_NEOID|nr:hypothetical protein NEOLI_005092 [Neolecta irregularis DAH-3]|eukprot:OLL24107.1 hypothetical protein NEOLI_005092 [Neolecta irregularis DAH-3]